MEFVKNNKADLISIIPFNSLFKGLRVLKIMKVLKLSKLSKLTKLVRLTAFFKRFNNKFDRFIKTNNFNTNNFNKVLYITLSIVLIGTVAISAAEDMTFTDSLWWSFVTTTTVGYGDISPSTNAGRIIASILMIVGIGFIGMLTGTIATYFLEPGSNKNSSYKDLIVDDAVSKLNDFDSLTKDELKDIFKVLYSLKD